METTAGFDLADPLVRAAFRAPRGAFFPHCGTEVIERDEGWYQIRTPRPTSRGNEVVASRYAGDDVDAHIDDVAADYPGGSFKWCVGPWTAPAHLDDHLVRRGFRRWFARGMVARIDELPIEPVPDVEVREVRAADGADFHAYLDAMARGWDALADVDALRGELARVFTDGDAARRHFFFVAYVDGVAVGTAGHHLQLDNDAAYLMGGVVLPEHRGRGVYRALIRARLDAVRDRVSYATTHAREATSAPILERLGFRTAFRYALCERQPPGARPE